MSLGAGDDDDDEPLSPGVPSNGACTKFPLASLVFGSAIHVERIILSRDSFLKPADCHPHCCQPSHVKVVGTENQRSVYRICVMAKFDEGDGSYHFSDNKAEANISAEEASGHPKS